MAQKQSAEFDIKQTAKTAIAGWLGAIAAPALLNCCGIDAGASGQLVGVVAGVLVDAIYFKFFVKKK